MLKTREQPYLTLESLGRRSCRGVRRQDLYRNLTVVLPVLGEKDSCHASATDLTTDGVIVSDGGLKGVEIDDGNLARSFLA